ncbi:MAG: radical SAM protein [Anaerolineae bacterium]|nr:radical SAM protein [Anaerolineae bacterium]
MGILKHIKSRLSSGSNDPSLGAGIYHFRRQNGEEKSRLHLRIDPDGNAILMVNANRVYHLNPSAGFMTFQYLEGVNITEACANLARRYSIAKKDALYDITQFYRQMDELVRPDGACPICDLELDTVAPFSSRPAAPYRMDLAITYRCNNACTHCYNPKSRHKNELETKQWLQVIDQLWQIGIPHIVFTGGEPTLRPDLPQLIERAQANGQITGLNTNGRRLMDAAYLQTLVDAGLDHVQITLESHDADIHDQMVAHRGAWHQTVGGIRNALQSPLFVMTNTTMLQTNVNGMAETLDFLATLGVPTVGLNALIYSGNGLTVGSGLPEAQLPDLLDLARRKTDQAAQRLIWYTPTQYCHFDPVQLELGVKGCTAALYNMCVEPDGEVLPCQSYYQSLGNITQKPWQQIWEHELAVSLRERKGLDEACYTCAAIQECGGGCPLAKDACQTYQPSALSALESPPW